MRASLNKNGKLTIGRLANAGGVGIATIRYYQKRGLLAQPHRPPYGGFRVYGEDDVLRLLQIKGAQELGFTLAEIAILLEHLDQRSCQPIKALIDEKQGQLKDQIDQLKKAHKRLSDLSTSCRGNCIGKCPLISKLGRNGAG